MTHYIGAENTELEMRLEIGHWRLALVLFVSW
jgi:hypothetical protein